MVGALRAVVWSFWGRAPGAGDVLKHLGAYFDLGPDIKIWGLGFECFKMGGAVDQSGF